MIEKQIKDEYRLGKRKGITELEDFYYMPVRITGSGLNLRKNGDEIIVADRQTTDFFNDAFLEHCKSLPIIVEHPVDENNEKDMLHSESLPKNNIVGNTIDAWIENDSEIWGLARLYDKTILDKIEKGEIQSTSPGVRIFFNENTDPDFKREMPYSINHLAFCERGHWDKPDGKAFDNSEKSKIDLTFVKELGILNQNESEVSDMVAEQNHNANDNPLVAGAVGGAVGSKMASDSEEKEVAETPKKEDEAKGEKANDLLDPNISIASGNKSNDSEDSKEDEKDKKDEGEKANDAGVDLSNAASLMAKASHAGVIKKDEGDKVEKETVTTEKKDEKEVPAVEPKEKDEKEEPKKADDSECIDSEDETEDDKKREDELKTMRKVCDSADANLGVKMPYISGRQTYRSIAHKFIQSNKQFLDKKYSNLALDSYTPELAKEVLQSVYENIQAKSSKPAQPKVGNYVQLKNGILCDPDF